MCAAPRCLFLSHECARKLRVHRAKIKSHLFSFGWGPFEILHGATLVLPRSKGVLLSHHIVQAHALHCISEHRFTQADVWLHVAPMLLAWGTGRGKCPETSLAHAKQMNSASCQATSSLVCPFVFQASPERFLKLGAGWVAGLVGQS